MSADPPLTLTFGITEPSLRQLERTKRTFVSMNLEAGAATTIAVDLLAERLRDAIKREFERHNKSGNVDDPAALPQGSIPTIDTLHLRRGPDYALISMAGGAPYVQYGFPSHVIKSKTPGGLLHFYWAKESSWVTVRSVKSPGYRGDDFVGRAMRDVTADQALRIVATRAFGSLMKELT